MTSEDVNLEDINITIIRPSDQSSFSLQISKSSDCNSRCGEMNRHTCSVGDRILKLHHTHLQDLTSASGQYLLCPL